MDANDKIKSLRTLFKISVSAYDLQFAMSLLLDPKSVRCYMHTLLLQGKEEIFKEFPDMEKIDTILNIIEEVSKR